MSYISLFLHRSYTSQLSYLISFFFLVIVFSGCSIRSYVINSVVGSGEGLGDLYLSEDDPQLVREAMPSNLKMIEALINSSPENPNLLLTATKAFTMYAYAFIQQDMDRMMVKDVHQAAKIRSRLRKLYARAKNYGFQGLEVLYPGFEDEYANDPQATLQRVKAEHVPYLYWTAAAWGGMISVSKSDPEVIIDFPHVGYFLDRALELDEDFNEGAIYEMMISYTMGRPDAGESALEDVRKYFERAKELTHGEKASLYVTYAEVVSVRAQNKEEFLYLLDKALSIDVDKNPSNRLANIIAQERARWLIEREEELFF